MYYIFIILVEYNFASMYVVKLNAINSTSTFLKEMIREKDVENFTIVRADYQINGRGQRKTIWLSEKGKNLLFSILLRFSDFYAENQFYLTCAVSLAVCQSLKNYGIDRLKIKWPNDIMAGNKKIAGILIENSLKESRIQYAVVGIGINVNQKEFPKELPNAISLAQILHREIDQETLLQNIYVELQKQIELLTHKDWDTLKYLYLSNLYKYQTPQMFRNRKGENFMGIIQGFDELGRIIISKEDETLEKFDLKEIKFL